jgi:CheY-like chemotaxis protein
LIVEDDPVVAAALRALLLRWGHDPRVVSTTAAALAELARAQAADAILLDLMLPDTNGIAVLRHVRERALPAKVAVLTAANDPSLLREARHLEPDLLLTKPLDITRLKQWLDGVAPKA